MRDSARRSGHKTGGVIQQNNGNGDSILISSWLLVTQIDAQVRQDEISILSPYEEHAI